MTLGQNIQAARKAKGLSQETLAEKVGVSRQALGKWEKDTALPGLDNLQALAAELGGALRADILKMPHHGLASYTRELHAAVQPKFATVSHTRGNETVEGVLATLTARGVQWRLTVKGTIVCTSDGTEWRIRQEEK